MIPLINQQDDKIIINSTIHNSLKKSWYFWLGLHSIFFGFPIIAIFFKDFTLEVWMMLFFLFSIGFMCLITIGSTGLSYTGQVELDLVTKVIKFHYPNALNKWYRQRLIMQPDRIPFQEIAEIYQIKESMNPISGRNLHPYCIYCKTIYQFEYPLVIVKNEVEFQEVLDVLSNYFKIKL